MATCAICQQPITTRSQVRVAGSEIIHAACAATGYETVGTRQLREHAAAIANLQSRLEMTTRDLARASARVADLQQQLAVQASENRLLSSRRDQLSAETRRLCAERDQARAELARMTVTPDSSEDADSKDPAETRFSLLELDPL